MCFSTGCVLSLLVVVEACYCGLTRNEGHLHSCSPFFTFPLPLLTFYLFSPALNHYISNCKISKLFIVPLALTWFINNQKHTFDRNIKVCLEAKFHLILNIYRYLKHLKLLSCVFTSCIRSWKVTPTCDFMTFALNCHLSQLISCETILP